MFERDFSVQTAYLEVKCSYDFFFVFLRDLCGQTYFQESESVGQRVGFTVPLSYCFTILQTVEVFTFGPARSIAVYRHGLHFEKTIP
jgi:hypothetical protein